MGDLKDVISALSRIEETQLTFDKKLCSISENIARGVEGIMGQLNENAIVVEALHRKICESRNVTKTSFGSEYGSEKPNSDKSLCSQAHSAANAGNCQETAHHARRKVRSSRMQLGRRISDENLVMTSRTSSDLMPKGSQRNALIQRCDGLTRAFLKTKNWLPDELKYDSMVDEEGEAGESVEDGATPRSGDGQAGSKEDNDETEFHPSLSRQRTVVKLDGFCQRLGIYAWTAYRYLKISMDNGLFDAASGVFILLNAILLMVQTEHLGCNLGKALQMPRPCDGIEFMDFGKIDMMFVVIFLVELIIRLLVQRLAFFSVSWNFLDVALVTMSLIEIVSDQVAIIGRNMTILRMMRLARLVKTLRLVRLMKSFRQLRVLVATIAGGAGALVWCVILVGTIEAVAAVFLAMILRGYLEESRIDDETRLFLWQYFGTFGRSFYTMFEVTFSGWHRVSRPMIEKVSPWFALFWMPYAVVVAFVVMRVVGAIFIKETFAQSSKEQTESLQEQLTGNATPIVELRHILTKYDTSQTGQLSKDEFFEAMESQDVRNWLRNFNIDPQRMIGLYELSDTGDGGMSLEEFIAGVFSLQSPDHAADAVTLMYVGQKVITWVQLIHGQMSVMREEQNRIAKMLADKELQAIVEESTRCGDLPVRVGQSAEPNSLGSMGTSSTTADAQHHQNTLCL